MSYFDKINEYKLKFKQSTFAQNIAVVTGGNVLAKMIGILSAPIITRLYLPEDYGIFSIFLSIIGVIVSFVTLNYAVTIPIIKEKKLVNSALQLCFIVVCVLSLFLTIVVLLGGDYVLKTFFNEKIKGYLWLIPIVFFAKGIYEILNNWAVRNKSFKLITQTKISQGITSTGTKLGLGFLGITPLGLFIGHFVQELSGITTLFLKLLKSNSEFYKVFSWRKIKYLAKRYKKFPLILTWSRLLLGLGAQLPILLIGKFYGLKVAGVFGLAQNMINMPMNLIGQSVAQVYYAEISSIGRSNPVKIYDVSKSIVKKLFFIGLVPVLSLLFFAPFIFKIVFGEEWYDAGLFARILSILILFRFISSPIMSVLNLFEKQGVQLILNVIRLVIVCLVFYLSDYLNFLPQLALKYYSLFISLFYLGIIYYIMKIIKTETYLK